MAKEIKAIKCPQCGSTAKTEIKPDVYCCVNCQTEYYLDDDDITVNYNHNHNYSYANSNPALGAQKTKLIVAIAAIVFVIITISILAGLLSKSAPTVNNSLPVGNTVPQKEYLSSKTKTFLPAQPDVEHPIAISLVNRTYVAEKDKTKDGYYLEFYDVSTKKQLSAQSLVASEYNGSQIDTKVFSDHNSYLIMDGELYKVNPAKYELENVTKSFFSGYRELQTGIATLSFVYDDFGDGLIIMTNDGRKFYLYPLVKKIYKEDDFYDAQAGFNTLLPNAKENTLFLFTGKSNDYPDEKQQLLKVRYKDNGAAPKDLLDNVSWGKDYGGSGIFTERDPYKKVLVSNFQIKKSRVLNWKDITPGRYYFNPEVLYGNGNELLIQFKADANPKSSYRVQKIDTQTGQPIWTKAINGHIIKEVSRFGNGYVALSRTDSVFVVDFKGNIAK